jgi:hypothetical protein
VQGPARPPEGARLEQAVPTPFQYRPCSRRSVARAELAKAVPQRWDLPWALRCWSGARVHAIASKVHASTHRPHESQRSTATAGFSRWQSTSMVMQYFTHFAQQMLSGSKIAARGQAEMHFRQSVHFTGSMAGNMFGSALLMTAMTCKKRAG